MNKGCSEMDKKAHFLFIVFCSLLHYPFPDLVKILINGHPSRLANTAIRHIIIYIFVSLHKFNRPFLQNYNYFLFVQPICEYFLIM